MVLWNRTLQANNGEEDNVDDDDEELSNQKLNFISFLFKFYLNFK